MHDREPRQCPSGRGRRGQRRPRGTGLAAPRGMRRTSWVPIACAAVCLGHARPGRATPPACPTLATAVVFADNRSAEPALQLAVDGDLLDSTATCDGDGSTTYHATLTCEGTGLVRCGTIPGLRAGAWVNRVTVTVTGSDPQQQSLGAVFLASDGHTPAVAVSNVVVWTVYPRTFAVPAATEADLRATVAAAAAYTDANPGPALVTFSRAAFPGRDAPQTVGLSRQLCPFDGFPAGLC